MSASYTDYNEGGLFDPHASYQSTLGQKFDVASMQITAAIDAFQGIVSDKLIDNRQCLSVINESLKDLLQDYLEHKDERPLPVYLDVGHPRHNEALKVRYGEHLNTESIRQAGMPYQDGNGSKLDKMVRENGLTPLTLDEVPNVISYLKDVKEQMHRYEYGIHEKLTELATHQSPEDLKTLQKLGIPLSRSDFKSIDAYVDVLPGQFKPDGHEYNRDNPLDWLKAAYEIASNPAEAMRMGMQLVDPKSLSEMRQSPVFEKTLGPAPAQAAAASIPQEFNAAIQTHKQSGMVFAPGNNYVN